MADRGDRQSKRPRTAEERAARKREKQPASSTLYTDIVWPRPLGEPFELPAHLTGKKPMDIHKSARCRGREYTQRWDEYDCFYYNGLLNVTFAPTQMFDIKFLEHVGWYEPLVQLSKNLGLGTLPFKTYPLLPDLVHQFLSTCRVRFMDDEQIASKGYLMFKIENGTHMITFDEIAALYEFDTGSELFIPDRNLDALWNALTGLPIYVASTAKQSSIKHPVLRMFVRMLSNTLLCTAEPGKMRKTELVLLHYAVGYLFDYCEEEDMEHSIHFGSVFAHLLEELKEKGLSGSEKNEFVGSLLVPIFQRVGIRLEGNRGSFTPHLLDDKRLKLGHVISGQWGQFRYHFHDYEGTPRQISLPSPHCRVDSADALSFRIPADDLVHPEVGEARPVRRDSRPPRTSRSRPSSSSSSSRRISRPFPMPPPGTYEDNPFNTWLVSICKTFWDHLRSPPRCCHTSDVARRAHTARPPSPPASASEDDEMAEDSDPSSESPAF